MRAFALIFGIFFLILSVVIGIHLALSDGLFLKIFKVNLGLDIFYFITGVLALTLAVKNHKKCRFFFQIAGSLYVLLALLGFIYGEAAIMGVFASSKPNSWFHMVFGVTALILGYSSTDKL